MIKLGIAIKLGIGIKSFFRITSASACELGIEIKTFFRITSASTFEYVLSKRRNLLSVERVKKLYILFSIYTQ